MKKNFNEVCILFFAFLFSLNTFSQNYTVGQQVNDSIGVFEYYGFNCMSYYTYPGNYSADINFNSQVATGLKKVLIITEFTAQSNVSFTESNSGIHPLNLGDTLVFDESTPYYALFLEDQSYIKGIFKIIGTPTVAGESYAALPFNWYIGMSECFAPHTYSLEGTGTVQDTVEALTPISIDTSVCEVLYFEGVEYLESGDYTQTIINEDNEEQEVNLSLEIQHLNYSLTESQGVIKSNQTNANYQWFRVDGQNIIELEGEVNRQITPTVSGVYFVRLTTALCDGFSQEESFEYHTDNVGVNSNEIARINQLENIQIYPNPFRENLQIELKDVKETRISIYSIQGKLVHQATIHSGINNINLQELPAGSYQLQIENNTDFSVQTIVKF
jgi:hypothetical protein